MPQMSLRTVLPCQGYPDALFFRGLFPGQYDIQKNTEDQGGCDGGNGDLTEVEGQTADTGDQDDRYYEQVLVLV